MTPANHDLRAWLNEVKKIGHLRRIQGVPWDKDMGGLVELVPARDRKLFDGGRYIGTDDLVIT
jgi:hypothetical protein